MHRPHAARRHCAALNGLEGEQGEGSGATDSNHREEVERLGLEVELRIDGADGGDSKLREGRRHERVLGGAQLEERALAQDKYANKAREEGMVLVQLLEEELREEELGDEQELQAEEAVGHRERRGEGFLRPHAQCLMSVCSA